MTDLDQLISAASEEQSHRLSRKEGASPSGATRVTQKRQTGLKVLLAVLVVVAVVLGVAQSFKPMSEKSIRTDLDAALSAAQAAVEDYYAVNEKLPDRVPSMALAQLVILEPIPGGCRLSLMMNGIAMSRDVLLPAK
jgi:hypothetical protein